MSRLFHDAGPSQILDRPSARCFLVSRHPLDSSSVSESSEGARLMLLRRERLGKSPNLTKLLRYRDRSFVGSLDGISKVDQETLFLFLISIETEPPGLVSQEAYTSLNLS